MVRLDSACAIYGGSANATMRLSWTVWPVHMGEAHRKIPKNTLSTA